MWGSFVDGKQNCSRPGPVDRGTYDSDSGRGGNRFLVVGVSPGSEHRSARSECGTRMTAIIRGESLSVQIGQSSSHLMT